MRPSLPHLLCLRLRWSSATTSLDACTARTVVMSGIEKPIGEVADLSGEPQTGARPGARSPDKVQFWAAGQMHIPALAIPSENGSLYVSDMACTPVAFARSRLLLATGNGSGYGG